MVVWNWAAEISQLSHLEPVELGAFLGHGGLKLGGLLQYSRRGVRGPLQALNLLQKTGPPLDGLVQVTLQRP